VEREAEESGEDASLGVGTIPGSGEVHRAEQNLSPAACGFRTAGHGSLGRTLASSTVAPVVPEWTLESARVNASMPSLTPRMIVRARGSSQSR
jgi:hypothetical protein